MDHNLGGSRKVTQETVVLTGKSSIKLLYPLYRHHVGCYCPVGLLLLVQVVRLPFLLSQKQSSSPGFLSATTVLLMVGFVFVPKVILDNATEQWGIKVARVEIKDVRIPVAMQRAIAAEAEAAREARAKVRSMAMSTPTLLCPCLSHPSTYLFSPHCKGAFSHYGQHHSAISISLTLQIVAAEGEMNASKALKQASMVLAESPAGLQLRYLQTLTTLATENNSTIVFPLPIDMLDSLGQKNRGG